MSAENTPDTSRDAEPRRQRRSALPSMRELLAAAKAADAVSTPPPDPDPLGEHRPHDGESGHGHGHEHGHPGEDRDAA